MLRTRVHPHLRPKAERARAAAEAQAALRLLFALGKIDARLTELEARRLPAADAARARQECVARLRAMGELMDEITRAHRAPVAAAPYRPRGRRHVVLASGGRGTIDPRACSGDCEECEEC